MNTQEELYPIKGYEGKYAVTKSGKVWSYPKTKRLYGKILKPTNTTGYSQLSLCINGKRKVFTVHRIVAQTFIPNKKNKPEVNHINGIKADNRVENLEWCTHKENFIHAKKNNLVARGERVKGNKIKNKDVIKIRKLLEEKILTQYEIAYFFNVTQSSISRIKRKETFGWII